MDAPSPVTVAAAGHFAYRRTWTTERAAPVDHLMIWVIDGTMEFRLRDRPYRAGAGDLVLLPPGVPHRYGATSGQWEWYWCHLVGPAVRRWWSRLGPDDRPVRPLSPSSALRDRFDELVRLTAAAGIALPTTAAPVPAVDEATRLVVDSCAHSLFGLVVHRLSGDAEGVRHAGDVDGLDGLVQWLLNHLGDDLDVAALAAQAGWSPAHLHRLLRRRWGVTPMRLLTRLRMERAERLLADTAMSVGEIARLVGYPDPLHFSRRFRELTGRPPSAAR